MERVQRLLSTGSLNINSRTLIVSGVGLTLTKVHLTSLEHSKIGTAFIGMTLTLASCTNEIFYQSKVGFI